MATNTTSSPSIGHDALALLGRILLAALFIPAGFSKLTGFAGTVGYIGSVGLPLPAAGAALAILVELGFGVLLLVGLLLVSHGFRGSRGMRLKTWTTWR